MPRTRPISFTNGLVGPNANSKVASRRPCELNSVCICTAMTYVARPKSIFKEVIEKYMRQPIVLLFPLILMGCARSSTPALSASQPDWNEYKILVWDATQAMDSNKIAAFFRIPAVNPEMDGELSEAYALDFTKVIICNNDELIKMAAQQLTTEEIRDLKRQVRSFETIDEIYSPHFKQKQLDDLRDTPK
jgi:hypothetical protein